MTSDSPAERVCLDAWAIMAWLADEAPAAELVESALAEEPVMSGSTSAR